MKIISMFLVALPLLFFTATCNQSTGDKQEDPDQLTVSGLIEAQGMTSYQYGTHTLTNEETFYALKSETVDLDEYINKEVTITAQKISGYPLSGGPEYLLVLEIKE